MTEGEKVAYDDIARQAFARQGRVAGLAAEGQLVGASAAERLRQSLGGAGRSIGDDLSTVAADAADMVHSITKKLPLAGMILAGALAAKIGYSEYQERSLLNETFSFQGYEPAKDYYSLQQQIESRTTSRYVDPLSAAGVVGNLNLLKQNHASMGPNKDQHLFAGVI
jgi:hypothetical protein